MWEETVLKSQEDPWEGGTFMRFHLPEMISLTTGETVKTLKDLEHGGRQNEGSACLKEALRGCVYSVDVCALWICVH